MCCCLFAYGLCHIQEFVFVRWDPVQQQQQHRLLILPFFLSPPPLLQAGALKYGDGLDANLMVNHCINAGVVDALEALQDTADDSE